MIIEKQGFWRPYTLTCSCGRVTRYNSRRRAYEVYRAMYSKYDWLTKSPLSALRASYSYFLQVKQGYKGFENLKSYSALLHNMLHYEIELEKRGYDVQR